MTLERCAAGHVQDAATKLYDADCQPYCLLCKVGNRQRALSGQSPRSRSYDALLRRESAARRVGPK